MFGYIGPTTNGDGCVTVDAIPNCPYIFYPKDKILKSFLNTYVWVNPVDICIIFDNPVTLTGVD